MITDYGLIGDCRSASVVSKYGSVDWCCLTSMLLSCLLAHLDYGAILAFPVLKFK